MAKTRVIIFALLLALAASRHCDGADSGEARFMQGVVSSHDYASFVLNERQSVNVNHATAYYDSRGREASVQAMAERRWVYVEGAPAPDGSITAEKVYFLPGYVNKKNRAGYGFMQLP